MPKRVLLIEDDADVREVIGMVLQTQGYEVLQASQGFEALELLRKSPRPDVIITDIMMPVMSGWEFLEAKASDPNLASIPVFVLSAAECRDVLERARVIAFLPKPMDFALLLQQMEEVC
jgi:CheY-like chemotaxis protein